jgi:hypothetical protein
MNSRAYLFILPLHAPGDIPDDFGASLQGRPFERGIFLPQADTEWFTQTPKYPARLLLLNGGCLHIVPHPTSGQDVVELNLADIVQLETGSSLPGRVHSHRAAKMAGRADGREEARGEKIRPGIRHQV